MTESGEMERPSIFQSALRSVARRPALLLVCGLFLIHAAVTAWWLYTDASSVFHFEDQSSHLSALLFLVAKLQLGDPGEGISFLLRQLSIRYSMITLCPHALAGWAFDLSRATLCLGNILYLLPLLLGVYGIGRHCHSRAAGVLAAAFVPLLPAVYGGSHFIGFDYIALCLTPVAVLLALRSEGFGHRTNTLLLGGVTGALALAKPQALIFLVGPALVQLVRGLRSDRQGGVGPGASVRLLNVALSTGIVLLVTSPWWGGRLAVLGGDLAAHVLEDRPLDLYQQQSLGETLSLYMSGLPELYTGPLLLVTALFLPAFLGRSRWRWEILLWILIPLLLFVMVIKGRTIRYLFPLVPAGAVILGVGIASRSRTTRWCLGIAVGGLAMAMWAYCTFWGQGERPLPGWLVNERPHLKLALSKLTSLGEMGFAGPKETTDEAYSAGDYRLYPAVSAMVHWLRRRHPAGRGALIHVDGETIAESGGRLNRAEAMFNVMFLVQGTLPRMRFIIGRRWKVRGGGAIPGHHLYRIIYEPTRPLKPPAGARLALTLPAVQNKGKAELSFLPRLYHLRDPLR